jgi:hypothetical protein
VDLRYAPNKMERKAVCTQIKEVACVIIIKGTLTLEFPDFFRTLEVKDGMFSA